MRGATRTSGGNSLFFMISIHTPHAGSDDGDGEGYIVGKVFQSTLPMRGATGTFRNYRRNSKEFQSTLPMRGATPVRRLPLCRK